MILRLFSKSSPIIKTSALGVQARRLPIILATFGLIVAAITLWYILSPVLLNNTSVVYLDSAKPVEVRVEDLLNRMTTAEKIGQLALVDKNSIHNPKDITKYGLGALLSGFGAKPEPNEPAAWLTMVNDFQSYAQRTRLKIPLLYGVDGIHGHTNVPGATVFPHFIGLGASQDVDLVRRVAQATAAEMAATGIYWNFSPNLDVVQDTRWGRTYESFGSDLAMVSRLGHAYLEGAGALPYAKIVSTAKHYLGAGDMTWGSSSNENFKMDQGITQVDEETLRRVHLPPFQMAAEAGVASVMVGLNTWNGLKLSANRYLLTDVLKGELGFTGFVVSDWYGVYEIPGGEYRAAVTAINAGVDMVMLPYDYRSFFRYLTKALETGEITKDRLDDAVRRILTVKFKTGLFDRPATNTSRLAQVGAAEHRAIAREAVRKSLVLLKNDREVLPLSKAIGRILVAGSAAHNLGRQSGAWTIEWQGVDGNWFTGTSILDGIKNTLGANSVVEYNLEANFPTTSQLADIGIAVVGEPPYAEGWGDKENPALTPQDLQIIAKLKAASKKLVVIIVSGRPLDIRPYAAEWDAVVAAWLPGTEGQGVADVLFGDFPFTGILPVVWPQQ